MTTYRKKLLYTLIMLVMVVMMAVGFLLGHLFKSYYIKTFNERIQNETFFISTYIQEHGGITSFLEEGKTAKLTPLLDSNLTILSASGEILYDSTSSNELHKNHANILRKIILEKGLKQEEGYEVIEGESDLHYYWKTVEKDGEIEGFVVHSNEIEAIHQVNKQMWQILIICLGVALIIILMLASKITSYYTRPIEEATMAAIELAKGNYRTRTFEQHSDETGMLTTSLNILARNLQETETAREMNQDRLETLVENIGSGVLLIDSKGYTTLINREFKKSFGVNSATFLFQVFYSVIKDQEVISIIEEIFRTEKTIKRQVKIPLAIERKHFEIYGAPIIGTHDEWKGILLIFHDITELKRLEQMRKDFVANVSHELRTPITSIKGFSETLLDGALKDEKTLKHFLSIILKESDRLQELIQELLNLSKMEQQEFVLKTGVVDITNVLGDIQEMLIGKLKEKEVSLEIKASSEPVFIEGESDRIKQVFINLITNALTYTPNGGWVTVNVTENEQTVDIIVQDSGIGIEEKELPRIFERFYRIDKARSRDSGGTGIGLAIVKHIIEVHKGKIKVESTPGSGTTFTVTLNKSLKGKV
ncbi:MULTISPECIES: two-component system histidine kinase PnpS [unclassified Peribacillus]|uniref:two-component system histidine kinase PnpS n=1 Tax=unclassified Peribacillus TaxID=2675266 RepID=UPI0006F90D9A|nr:MULTISPECIES: ATP-binding protein [unclassified Peribacillus]KQU14982.1 PAS domain-containing sensor histidine kinase [Bacillus sp. Leaf13]MBK5462354.1 PAS domain S-box protein [Peribacillus sp. TH27]MBK5500504.1 PAS domain S-box protein [Peribacillus sp. TH14]